MGTTTVRSDLMQSIAGASTAEELLARAQHAIDRKTKPPGSLGRLEEIAIQLCAIQQTLTPRVDAKAMLVFAADHGITAEGVSAYPSSVTPQMVANFLAGGAAINAFCRLGNIELTIVDVGVDHDFEHAAGLVCRKVRRGTRNFALGEAMTGDEAELAIGAGIEAVETAIATSSAKAIGLGEMGIGNTTSAAAIVAAITGADAASVVGRGAGLDDEGVAHKIEVVRRAIEHHRPDSSDPLDVLRKVGGYEIGAIAGAVLAAAACRRAVVLDGLISTAGALLAWRMAPGVRNYLFFGHRSVEIGHGAALDVLGGRPLLDLGLRLGEGTGAALAMHLLDAACRFMGEMASFESAGVADRG
jgi:nicotinate-nucleotide--dimethylbenzimidazole phosphoribosyltransferase